MNKFNLSLLSAALCLALSGPALAGMTKAEFAAAKDELASKYKTEKAACNSQSGNAKDICIAEAKGREKVGKAEAEASFSPSEQHRYDVRLAMADAAYAVAKEKCDDAAGNAKDVCLKEAKSTFVTAKADAKLAEKTSEAKTSAQEKTQDANAMARGKTNEARKDASAEKRDAAYAVAKEKCEVLAGAAKEKCVMDAKTSHGQN